MNELNIFPVISPFRPNSQGRDSMNLGHSSNCIGMSSVLTLENDEQPFSLSPRERAGVREKVASLSQRVLALCTLAFCCFSAPAQTGGPDVDPALKEFVKAFKGKG